MDKQNALFDFATVSNAFDYANFDHGDNQAFLDRKSGKSLYFSAFGDSDPEPEDFADESRYIALPDKRDLGLGTELVYRFINATGPDLIDATRDAFRQRGAYRRFKALLESNGLLDAWHEFEANAEKTALLNWCEENGIQLSNSTD